MMLGDTEIQALHTHLGAIVRDNQQHHDNMQELLQRFQDLLENYNCLKSDYEEEKEAREKYKKLARGQDRNPFALVLVDGDGYVFKEQLIKNGAEGGITAARLLSDSVKELLHERLGYQGDQCRIMVRIYSNILGLSKTLARAGLVGNEARSLSPFASSFTRSQELFDYVDAGDKKEGADYKIREMFRLFADHNQCKHIFFAGCHDSGYLSLLTPYRGNTDRITLLKGSSFHHEYQTLGLPVRDLPSVFMSTPVGGITHYPPSPPKPVCKHFQKGICRFGNECSKLHVMPNQQISKNLDETQVSAREQAYYAKSLPTINAKSEEFIAVNKEGDRIDTYCSQPTQDAWELYNRRAKRHKLCNKYHLGGECGDMGCAFDHSHVDASALNVMRYILRQHPCSRGTTCRAIKCYLGHICQKDMCKGTKPCRFTRHAHTLDLRVSQWLTPIDQHDIDESPISENSVNSTTDPNNTYSYLMKGIVD